MSIDVMRQAVKGTAAGVPYVALPLGDGADGHHAPLVVSWHMMEPPRTEAAMAAALPMTGVPAWRVYFGLPKFGTQIPLDDRSLNRPRHRLVECGLLTRRLAR